MEVPGHPVVFVVRVVATPAGGLAGIVERVRTGERHRFVGLSELSRLIEALSAAARKNASPDDSLPGGAA
jgi:hypothetical protein